MKDIDVSVLMSVYNTPEKWLRECIESILAQSFCNFEYIIVLDCPTDKSEEVVHGYAARDKRIQLIKNNENLGLTKSLNKGLSIAQGRYIARIDSDDVAFRSRLEKQFSYMEKNPETVAVGSQICTSLDVNNATKRFPVSDWTPDSEVLKIRMLFHNVGISHPTAMIRKSVLTDNNIKYDENIKKSQDYKLWVDLMQHGKIDMINEVLLMYRVHDGQISADRSKQYYYVSLVAAEQAERLIGELSEEERGFHRSIGELEIYDDNLSGYKSYYNKLMKANDERKIYDTKKFKREMDYLWCRKAFRRMVLLKKADMIFDRRSLTILKPEMIHYLIGEKKLKNNRIEAIKMMNIQDYPLL